MNQIQKQQIIQQLERHYKNDEIVKGKYWQDGKGCCIGCIAHSDSHEKAAEILDIPLWMAYLIDNIFEGLPNKDAKEFPLKFVRAKPENADKQKLEMIRHKLALYQLNHICKDTDHPLIKDAIDKVRELHQKVINGKKVSREEWLTAVEAAGSAAWSAAWSAVASAGWSARSPARSAAYKKIADKLIEYVKEAEN